MIARKFPSQRSLLGSIIDPVADKLLISTLFVTLTYKQLIPGFLILFKKKLNAFKKMEKGINNANRLLRLWSSG